MMNSTLINQSLNFLFLVPRDFNKIKDKRLIILQLIHLIKGIKTLFYRRIFERILRNKFICSDATENNNGKI